MLARYLILLFLFSWAQAQVVEGPITASLGGAGRAGLDANEGAYLNPALISLQPNAEGVFYFRDGDADSGEHRNYYGASLSEVTDVMLPGQLSYFKSRKTGILPVGVDEQIWMGSFAYLIQKRFSVGISIYDVQKTQEGFNQTDQWNGAFGAVFLIHPNLGVAYVFENPANASSSIPEPLRLARKHSIGVYYSSPYRMRARLDLTHQEQLNPGGRNNVMAGLETAVQEFALVRVGMRFDELNDRRFITAGLGFNGPKFKIDYSFEKNLERSSGAVHSVDLRMVF